jgi:hypothetical protein
MALALTVDFITLSVIVLVAVYALWVHRSIKETSVAGGMKALVVFLVFATLLTLSEIASELGLGQESFWDIAEASLLSALVILNCLWVAHPLSVMKLGVEKSLDHDPNQDVHIVHVTGSDPAGWYCDNCGAKLYLDNTSCNGCGARVDFS